MFIFVQRHAHVSVRVRVRVCARRPEVNLRLFLVFETEFLELPKSASWLLQAGLMGLPHAQLF